MSRCFPFPPPGYEKKITTDELNPLLKDKSKEKKQRKDNKDKEKKEGKEKKSRDRSKDKYKDKKDKKEKHKDRKDKDPKDKERSKPSEEKKAQGLTNTAHIEKSETNSNNGESKYVQDLARRITYEEEEEEATGSHSSAQKINHTNQKDVGITGRTFRDNDDQRSNTQKTFSISKGSQNAIGRVSLGTDQKRAQSMGKPMGNREPEKSHHKESATKSDKPGVKDKDKYEGEKKGESINKTRQENGKDTLDLKNCKLPDPSKASVKNLPIAVGNLGKRKDHHETNGFLHGNGTMPNKLQRHSENGRTLGTQRTPSIPVSEVSGTDRKSEGRVNGFVLPGGKQTVCPPPNHSVPTMKVKNKENGESSSGKPRPPHPDLKYLDHILNVPKRELLLEVDNNDQEWLSVKLKKTRRDSPDSGESLQVWDQALRIESTDIVALPYVIPF